MQSSVSWVPHSLEQSKQTSHAATNEQQTEGEEKKKNLAANLEIFFGMFNFSKKSERGSHAPRVSPDRAFWQLCRSPFPLAPPQTPHLAPRSSPDARAHVRSPENPGTQTAFSFSDVPKQAKLLNPF